VLVQKAAFLQQPQLLASWLYGVAYRTAQHARVRAARRSQHERKAASMASVATDPVPDEWEEMRAALDDELQRLPEFYRAPLVLCYLEGKTNVEAAHILNWPTGSVSARLAKARALLRERLTRRQRVLPGLLLLDVFRLHPQTLTVPGSLVEATVHAVRGLTAGESLAGGLVSPAVKALTEDSLRTLGRNQRRRRALFAAVLLAVLSFGTGAYTWGGGWPALNRALKAIGLPILKNSREVPTGPCH
jgi:polysaccharide export outer membrane protein